MQTLTSGEVGDAAVVYLVGGAVGLTWGRGGRAVEGATGIYLVGGAAGTHLGGCRRCSGPSPGGRGCGPSPVGVLSSPQAEAFFSFPCQLQHSNNLTTTLIP